jgi:hypothetical protein
MDEPRSCGGLSIVHLAEVYRRERGLAPQPDQIPLVDDRSGHPGVNLGGRGR